MAIDSGLWQNSGAELKYYLRHTGSTSKRVTFIDLFKMFHLELEIGWEVIKSIILQLFCRKLHENKRIWTPGVPLWIGQCWVQTIVIKV